MAALFPWRTWRRWEGDEEQEREKEKMKEKVRERKKASQNDLSLREREVYMCSSHKLILGPKWAT